MSQPDAYLLLQDGQQTGPFPLETLQQMVETGTIQRDDFVWKDGMPDWVPLASLLPAAAPTPSRATIPMAHVDLPEEHGFGWYLHDALSYPFRGDGFIILIVGTIAFTVFDFVGRFSIVLSIAAWGYLLLMLQQVLHSTAMGENRLPDWPDFDGFGELFTKAIQWLAVVAVSFGPAIFLGIAAEKEESDGLFIGTMAAFVVGGIYFPMAILSVGMHDSVGGLNPLGVFHGIFKIPRHYLVTLVVFFVLAGVQFLASQLSGMIPIGGALIDKLDELWSAVFLSRVLGGLYYVNRRKLSWFGE
jgi:hypothetical protein